VAGATGVVCDGRMAVGAAWKRDGWVVGGVVAVTAALAGLAVLLGPVADRSTPQDRDRAAAVNATRQILLASAAGLAALIGLGFTAPSDGGRPFLRSKSMGAHG
jgi:hypothetical protein